MTLQRLILPLLVSLPLAVAQGSPAPPAAPSRAEAPTQNLVESRDGRIYPRPGFHLQREPGGAVAVRRNGGAQEVTGTIFCQCTSGDGFCTIGLSGQVAICSGSESNCRGECAQVVVINTLRGTRRVIVLRGGERPCTQSAST